jgi:AraC-like DNA-binding protein
MTAVQNKFIVDLGWRVLLKDVGLNDQDVLRRASLPLDLFGRESPTLTTSEYLRLWEAMAHLQNDPAFPLRLGQAISVEAFNPPIFACFCSANLNAALARLAQYKPLCGPLRLDVQPDVRQTVVALAGLPGNAPLPPSLIAAELVFLVHLARLATREHVVPEAVHVEAQLPGVEAYECFFGCRVERGARSDLAFSAADAQRPFLTASEKMWSVFEPELRKRMADLDPRSTIRERVRACLIEILASGQYTMADVAQRLAVSHRTLQRRLHEEGTNFQQELNGLREQLARHYLVNTSYSSAEIAFLLGYDDPNSFFRAFHAWTGQTPESTRSAARNTGSATFRMPD